jgi:hypothetical protein
MVSTGPGLPNGFCINNNKYGSISLWILALRLLLLQKKARERSLRATA